VKNDDLSLRPGMTATSTITAVERKGVLMVPNAALRYSPQSTETTAKAGSNVMASMMPRMPRTGARKAAGGTPKQVWVLRDGAPVAVPVKLGISDGRMTEITDSELKEGMAVITDQRAGDAAAKP
jgi:HlyD family secretion protein